MRFLDSERGNFKLPLYISSIYLKKFELFGARLLKKGDFIYHRIFYGVFWVLEVSSVRVPVRVPTWVFPSGLLGFLYRLLGFLHGSKMGTLAV